MFFLCLQESSTVEVRAKKSSELIKKLLAEEWMPPVQKEEPEYVEVLDTLIGVYDDNQAVVFDGVCDYLVKLYE